MKLLIIDDERDVLDLASTLLTRHRVITATSGEEGIALAAREHPDAVLLDCVLRGMAGEEVLARLRAQPATRDTPVILLTGKDQADDIRQFRSLGARGLVAKPIRISTFAQEVERALAGEFITAAPAAAGNRLLDDDVIAALRDLQSDDDPTFFTDLIATFLSDAEERMQKLSARLEAGDLAEVSREAHSLKSSAGNVGAIAVASIAAAIDREASSTPPSVSVQLIAQLRSTLADTRERLVKLVE